MSASSLMRDARACAVALIVGVILPGGTGETITAIAAALLALTIAGSLGIGKAEGDRLDRRGRRRL
jgi:hypothetical protein